MSSAIRAWSLSVVVFLAGACGPGGSAFTEDFTTACTTSSNMGRAICSCMAEKAQNELNADERAFVLAVLQEDDAAAERVRGKLGFEGGMRAGMFMTKAGACAREGSAAKGDPGTP
jgi:hypothetical protein